MGGKYFFIVAYVWLKEYFSRGDYSREESHYTRYQDRLYSENYSIAAVLFAEKGWEEHLLCAYLSPAGVDLWERSFVGR